MHSKYERYWINFLRSATKYYIYKHLKLKTFPITLVPSLCNFPLYLIQPGNHSHLMNPSTRTHVDVDLIAQYFHYLAKGPSQFTKINPGIKPNAISLGGKSTVQPKAQGLNSKQIYISFQPISIRTANIVQFCKFVCL